MPILSDATIRLAHTNSKEAWKIVFPEPNDGRPITVETELDFVHVTYTDLDGNKTSHFFQSLRDSHIYIQSIEYQWVNTGAIYTLYY